MPVYATICTIKEIYRALKITKGLKEGSAFKSDSMFIPVLIATIKVNKILKYLQSIDEVDKNSRISSVYIFYCREMDPDL